MDARDEKMILWDKNEVKDVTDIIEVEYLQRLQDALGSVIGITTTILNPEGIPVTKPTNLHAFCEMMQASPTGVQLCMRTNTQLIEIGRKTKKTTVVSCPNSGLKTAAVPIFLGDKFLGSWLIGQMRTDEIDEKLIEETAIRAGLSIEEAQANIRRLAAISESEFSGILNFLETVIVEISRLVEMNDELNEKNAELVALTERLNRTASTFKEFIDLSDVGVYVVDFETGKLIMANRVYEQMLGKTIEEITEYSCFNLMGYQSWCPFCPREKLKKQNGDIGEPIVWENYLAEADMWLQISSRIIRWADGRLAMMVTYFDITDRKKREEEIEYIAYYDRRLKVPNGAKLFADIQNERTDYAYLIGFDIQGLRKINDIYGRETGDSLLSEIKEWILSLDDHRQQLYRIDGDEFAVLIRNEKEDAVMAFANRIFDRFDEAWTISHGDIQQNIFVSVSMGVIPVNSSMDSHEEVINFLERVLSVARNSSKPVLYDIEMDREFSEHLRLEISLKNCVLDKMKGFSLHYQPIVDAVSGQWVGMEALCRWHSPDVGNVPPIIFIQEAEKLGLIDIVGEWVLNQAVSDAKKWGLDKLDRFVLDVNLSPVQLNDRNLYKRVARVLKEHDYPAKKLSLEITESAEVHFSEHIMTSLNKLRELGLYMSLDDFGTGYASFSNLKSLPITVIKTDRSFVQDIEKDTYLQHTVKIMIDFAHAAGMKVTVEGVETEGQKKIMLENGADYIQGYLFSRPLPGDQIEKSLDSFCDLKVH